MSSRPHVAIDMLACAASTRKRSPGAVRRAAAASACDLFKFDLRWGVRNTTLLVIESAVCRERSSASACRIGDDDRAAIRSISATAQRCQRVRFNDDHRGVVRLGRRGRLRLHVSSLLSIA